MNYMPYQAKSKNFPYNQFSEKFSNASLANAGKVKKEGDEILQNEKLSPSNTTKNNEINFPVNHHILSSNNIGLYLDFPMKKKNSVSNFKNSNSNCFHEFAKKFKRKLVSIILKNFIRKKKLILNDKSIEI